MATFSIVVLILILAIVAVWAALNHRKSRVLRLEENRKAAWISLQCGSVDLPSWINNKEELSEFLFEVQRLALRKGVPHRKILAELSTEHLYVRLISFAGALERRNATFAEQKLAAAEAISKRFAYDERMRAEADVFFSA